ncbi:MAG: hypothetical protein EOL97_05575 [Spirochaetia bacterium]|nr:hypothetical protein [Spirochaetia bacterium]
MRKKRIIILSLVLLSGFSILSAKSLENLVKSSIDNSTQITNLELNKNYTMLNLEGSELKPKTKVSLSSEITKAGSSYTIGGGSSSLLSVVIPGSYTPTTANQISDTTTINIAGSLDIESDTSSVTPDGSLSLSHNFLIGDYTNNQKDINNQITLLKATQAYESGVITFKKNLYSYVTNILTNEKSQREFEKKIKDQEKTITDGLALNQFTKDALVYKQYNLILKTYKDTLENLQNQKQALLDNFKEYSGVEYQEVDTIREPNLEINNNFNDSISIQLAKLNVKLKQDDIDQVEREKTQQYLNVNTYVQSTPYASASEKNAVGLLATYGADNFTINAGTNLDFTLNTSISPTFRVGGTWTNDTTSESDLINNKLNENELISAQLTLNSTIQNDVLTKLNLNSQITNWKAQYKQLEDNIQFNEDNLKLNKQMFDLGLISQKEIDDLSFDLEQLNYDKLSLLLEGLSLELDIEKTNL